MARFPGRCVSLALLGVLLPHPESTAAPQPVPPAVRLIATGGTITNRPGGRLTVEQLVAAVPTLSRYAQVETEQFANVPSSALTVTQWIRLSRRITAVLANHPDLAGIVVTGGTDTLEETAYFLHLTVRSNRPVVVAGSMRPPHALGSDGPANLLQAFRVAADPASRGRGVLVVLNNDIHSAREVTKADTRQLGAFRTYGYGPVGVVDPDRVVYRRRLEHRHTSESEFDLAEVETLPRVDVLVSYQDAPGDLIAAAVAAGADGLVIAGAGSGTVSPAQHEAIRAATEKGVPVVVTSRTGGGRVAPWLPPPNGTGATVTEPAALRITGEDLAPVKARILLMLALTRTREPAEIRRMFAEY